WIGRPLLGQWVMDVRAALDALEATTGDESHADEITLVGIGPAGIVALCAGAIDERIGHTVAAGSLASYLSDVPYENQRLGLMAPGIVRDVGDIPHIAALLAPRGAQVTIAGGVTGAGAALEANALTDQYAPARTAFALCGKAERLRILPAGGAGEVLTRPDAAGR